MATIRLIPSAYTLSNTSYLTISNASNMYDNTDDTSSYAQVTHNRSQNSTYYLYIHGFNFDDIDESWTINSFSVKLRALESSLSTSSSYRCSLYNSSTSISNTTLTSSLSTTSTVYTFPTSSLDWDTLKNYGNNFRIRVPLRRASSGTSGYVRIYGAEIEVTYTIPVAATVTSTLSGNGTISPSGAYQCYEGDEYTLTITPTDSSSTVTATKNGVDITSQLVAHGIGGTESTVLGTYTLESGGFNGQGASYFQGIVGNGVDATQTSSNYYSSGSGTTAVFTYSLAFTNIPSNATIERVYVEANGHAESTSNTNEYMCIQLKSGSVYLSEQYNWKDSGSTSNSTHTLEATTLPTVSQLASMVLECTLGYYGGAINGATCYVVYSVPSSNIDHYTYTYTVDGNATIAVTIAGSTSPPVITVGTPSRLIISDESGYDQCICTFQSNMALQAWEVRATKEGVTPARGVGLLVESGTTLAANTDATIYVDDEELTQGDGEYTITVYGQSTGGIWSE